MSICINVLILVFLVKIENLANDSSIIHLDTDCEHGLLPNVMILSFFISEIAFC